MTEVSPLILNGYLSHSYKIFGPTVNPSRMSLELHQTNGENKRRLESGSDPAGHSIFSKTGSRNRRFLTISAGQRA